MASVARSLQSGGGSSLQMDHELHRVRQESLKRQTVDLAVKEGVKAGVGAAVLSGAAVYAGHRYSPWFRRSLGLSGKLGLVMCSITGAYFLVAELALLDAQRHPDAYGLSRKAEEEAIDRAAQQARVEKITHITPRHFFVRAANYLYDHPFHMVIGTSVPLVGGILAHELRKPGIKLSQAIIHTRVQGQMAVVTILALTMGFRDWMHSNGGRLQD